MYNYPNSTYKILGYKSQYIFNFDKAVDWACDMLTYGYDTDNLLILSAITKPTCQSECESYFLAALTELNLPVLSNDKASFATAWMNVYEMSLGVNVWPNLTEIYSNTDSDPDSIWFDFRLLYWAKDEPYYWSEEMTSENAKDIVVQYAKEWLEKYKNIGEGLLT